MDEHLLAAYRRTDYRVRLPGGGKACLHVDQPLPVALHALVGASSWGFITAWHPTSRPTPREINRHAQRQLLAALRDAPSTRGILPAIGVGVEGWREPSLFAIGTNIDTLDCLAHEFGQLAFLAGDGPGIAVLRWTKRPA